MPEPIPAPIPAERFRDGDFVAACNKAADSLIYFLLNVGDGDTQLLLLPGDPDDPSDSRRAIVIDVATTDKLPALVETLHLNGLFPERVVGGHEFPIVVGTHPHAHHIGGMPQFLSWFGDHVTEYWDSGYYHPSSAYLETMTQLERLKKQVTVTQRRAA